MDVRKKRTMHTKTIEDFMVKSKKVASWESRNEGIHERVNFDDTIWGFDLAGGAYYKTPLRVTMVKENSRAENANIQPGDVLRKINDIDTALLTLQEAHDMIVESGLQLRLIVTAPDVEETTFYSYSDQIQEDAAEEKSEAKKPTRKVHGEFKGAKVNEAWSEAWPCFKRRTYMFRESNCFLVPSKFEDKHQDQLKCPQVIRLLSDPVYLAAGANLVSYL